MNNGKHRTPKKAHDVVKRKEGGNNQAYKRKVKGELVDTSIHVDTKEGLDEMHTKGGTFSAHVYQGDNAKFIRHATVCFDLPVLDLNDIEAVKARVVLYFNTCAENDMKPNMAGICNYLGICRSTLLYWLNGETRDEAHYELAKNVYTTMEQLLQDYIQQGKIHPITGIFLLKADFGYKDNTDSLIKIENNVVAAASPEQLQQKYSNLICGKEDVVVDVDLNSVGVRKLLGLDKKKE